VEENNKNDLDNGLAQLLAKQTWTKEEKQWLLDFLENTDSGELQMLLRQQFELREQNLENTLPYDPAGILQQIHEKAGIPLSHERSLVVRFWRQGVAAASVILGFALLGYFVFIKRAPQQFAHIRKAAKESKKEDIGPGTNKAMLLLDNGANVILDDARNGILAREGNVNIVKSGEKLDYQSLHAKSDKIAYNTIVTPRGGQYQVELSDGTKVWLNAASSIRFPASFPAKERVVEISGEVYFEVAALMKAGTKDKVPFIVKINTTPGDGGEVKVLGTHFDIMAYPEEPEVRTTLLEGSVVYNNNGNSQKLLPGQQSAYSSAGGIKVREDIKTDDIISWKNGSFHFEGCDLEVVLRQLSRWYDADVVFKRKIDDKFYADIPMNTMLSDALKALELTGLVHFTIENGKIIVH